MTETYYLNGSVLPTIPVPHDGEIERLFVEDNNLIFQFKDSEYNREIFNTLKPGMNSLTIKYHMPSNDDFCMYKYFKPNKLLRREHGYRYLDNKKLSSISKEGVEYLYHNVGYLSIITKLAMPVAGGLIIDAEVDYVEFEWEN